MLRRNSFAPLLILISLTILLTANAQTTGGTPPAQPPAQPSGQAATPASPPAQAPGAATPASPPAQAPGTATPPSAPAAPSTAPAAPAENNGATQAPATEDSGVFVFKKQVEEVVLHATVIDDKQAFVTNLEKTAFIVYENGRPQNITSFRHEDIPVAMGIVVDNSGSMREKRQKVNAAALNLVRASNSNDEVFIVNFNDEYYLDQDFTSSIAKLKAGLEKIEARGGTALYDAVVASADHLKSAKLEKKVIFVVTDGEDNASAESLEQAVRHLQAENGPTVYAIGILGDEEHPRRAKRALAVMSERTGGVAFFPKTLDEVDAISREVARDIRNQYTIGYKPSTPRSTGGYRTIKVDARAHGHGKLTVRTKSGYYAGQERAAGGE